MNTWNLRQEILSAAHRWYWIAASFLLGAFLGWLLGLIWPVPFRATQDVYVGLNAYRATQDRYINQIAGDEVGNLNDFKYWQMSQLNSLALSDEYLQETLDLLLAEDSAYWHPFTVPDLRAILSISWRDAGDWHFRAESDDPERASQAVVAWTQVVTEKVGAAVEAARQVVLIDSQLSAVSKALVEAEEQQRIWLETQPLLAAWETTLEEAPSDQPLSPLDHWNLLSLVTAAADFSAGWQAVLEAAPDVGSLPEEYVAWLQQVQALIATELAQLPAEVDALETQFNELSAAYELAADQSRALSATLEVGPIKGDAPQITSPRPIGTWLLIGGMLGVLTWGLGWLVQISRRSDR